jgi:GNAT superfamily N-acetyltransferase
MDVSTIEGRGVAALLRDGTRVTLRAVRDDDGPAIRALLGGLSPASLSARFFGTPDLDRATRCLLAVDERCDFSIVVLAGEAASVLVAHAAYLGTGRVRAEVAFVVADEWQGRGVAPVMLAGLVQVARQRGVSALTAEVLPHNERMIAVFAASRLPLDVRAGDDVIEVTLTLRPTDAPEPSRGAPLQSAVL